MDGYNGEYTEISLVDIVALCFRKFITLLICAIIGAALVLGYHIVSAGSEKGREAYASDLARYNIKLQSAEDNFSILNASKAKLLKRIEENPVSDIADGTTYRSELVFIVSSDEDPLLSMDGTRIYNTVVSINGFWSTLELSELIGGQYKNEYIRQFIFFEKVSESDNGFVFRINAYSAKSPEQADEYAEKVFEAFSDYLKTIPAVKTCTVQSSHNEVYTGSRFLDIVNRQLSDIAETDEKIFAAMDEIKEAESTRPYRYHIAKYAIIGFLAGFVAAALVIAVGFVNSDPLTSTEEARKKLKTPVLGILFCENGFFSRIARKILGECDFKDEASALSWLENNLDSSVLPDNAKVAVLYSGTDEKAEKTFEPVSTVFKNKGYGITFIDNVAVNPDAMTAIQNADVVVLFEKQWASKWKDVKSESELAARYGKKVAGLVIC